MRSYFTYRNNYYSFNNKDGIISDVKDEKTPKNSNTIETNRIINNIEKNDYSMSLIGKKVKIVIDRQIGDRHPKHSDVIYPINYGYLEGVISGDNEELDAYVLDVLEKESSFEGYCIGVVHRLDEDDDKLLLVQNKKDYTKDEIRKIIHFQEKYHTSIIIF